MKTYNGWTYDYSENRPASGPWRAVRRGVGLNNLTEEGLKRMIDQKNNEQRNLRVLMFGIRYGSKP